MRSVHETSSSTQYAALDRDGTVLTYVPYLVDPEEVRLAPGAAPSIALLNRAGIKVIIVTNQSAVSRGYLSLEGLAKVHARMISLLSDHEAHVDEILTCPHAPSDGCECRKPLPGLLRQYLMAKGLAPERGYIVGDNITDIELAFNIGGRPIHVQSGTNSRSEVSTRYPSVISKPDLAAAVRFILTEEQ